MAGIARRFSGWHARTCGFYLYDALKVCKKVVANWAAKFFEVFLHCKCKKKWYGYFLIMLLLSGLKPCTVIINKPFVVVTKIIC